MSKAKLRSVNTHFWTDTFIVGLDPTEKLMFLYLLTNPLANIAGVYEISLRQIAFDVGLSKEKVQKILKTFEDRGKIAHRDGWIVLKNFLKNQNLNTNMQKGVETLLANAPEWAIETLSKDSKGLKKSESKKTTLWKDEREREEEGEREGEEPPPLNKPALALYEEMFGTVGIKFGEQIQLRVKDLGIWQKLLSDKSSFADDPVKRKGVSKWILSAYDECIEEKKNERKQSGRLPTVEERVKEREAGLKNLQLPTNFTVQGVRSPRPNHSAVSEGDRQS